MAFAVENHQGIRYFLRSQIILLADHDSSDARSNGSSESNESNDYTEASYPGILDTQLTALSTTERIVFVVIVTILSVLSVCGNIGTLHVNFHRKIRPFFRACLISLAISDLVNTGFLCVAYIGQFTPEYVQIWILGPCLCRLVPFVSTSAILASSLTLVGIAWDRYFAVMKAVITFWNPGVTFCVASMLLIWGISLGVSSPVLSLYELVPVYILSEVDNPGDVTKLPIKAEEAISSTTASYSSAEEYSITLVREQRLVHMCISTEHDKLYYVTVFALIFIPCILAFIWFNSIIAKKIWRRRHATAAHRQKCKTHSKKHKSFVLLNANREVDEQEVNVNPSAAQQQYPKCNCSLPHPASTTMPSSLAHNLGGDAIKLPCRAVNAKAASASGKTASSSSSREARHIRMFIIIVVMMAVFIFLRLPAWVFLIMRMYGNYTHPLHWILYFTFGILNVASSALNPLFYTFLAETIQCIAFVRVKVCYEQCGWRAFRERYRQRKSQLPPTPSCNYGDGCEDVGAVPSEAPRQRSALTCFDSRQRIGCCAGLCCGGQRGNGRRGRRAFFACYQQKPTVQVVVVDVGAAAMPSWLSTSETIKQKSGELGQQAGNNDKDEGVECSDTSDEGDEGGEDFYEYSQRIYTIFPPSLVSSSVTSQ